MLLKQNFGTYLGFQPTQSKALSLGFELDPSEIFIESHVLKDTSDNDGQKT